MIGEKLNAGLRRVPIWLVYLIGAIPAPVYFLMAVTGRLGVEPIKALEHAYGELALQILIAGLCITPLRRFAALNLLRFRRALGLLAFLYICLHLAVWLVLDVQIMSAIWADIIKRPYITIGMLAFVLAAPLAITSNNKSVRLLRAKWRVLHRLTYPIVFLSALHFVMLVKGWQIEPLIYMGIVVVLLALRLPMGRWKIASS